MEADKGLPVTVIMKTTVKDGPQKNINNIKAEGQLFQKGPAVFLRFEEPAEDGKKTIQTLKVKPNEMTVIRKGAITMNQRFIAGIETEGMYQSPYGPMSMTTKTKQVDYKWDEANKTGKLRLRYTLHLQGSKAGDYDMQVTIKEAEESS